MGKGFVLITVTGGGKYESNLLLIPSCPLWIGKVGAVPWGKKRKWKT
jgi:hypothetical protein